MIDPRQALLTLLADGEFHSGEALGSALGCSRAAVWKQVRALRAMGLAIRSQRSRGYRLDRPVDLLTPAEIARQLPADTRSALGTLEVLFTTDSTSDRLIRSQAPVPGHFAVCVAEHQTGGRGRRGRRWLSPLGAGLYLSVGWTYDIMPGDFPTLGLAVGVALAETLEGLGAAGVGLKWPNDLVCTAGKLGGILIDVAGESGGPLRVVVGVGVNVRTSEGLAGDLGQIPQALPVASLEDLWRGRASLSRCRLAAAFIAAIQGTLASFPEGGFAPFSSRFADFDALYGHFVTASTGAGTLEGRACGVAADGSLLVQAEGVLRPVVAGEVTVRGAP